MIVTLRSKKLSDFPSSAQETQACLSFQSRGSTEFSRKAVLQRDVTQGNPLCAASVGLEITGLGLNAYVLPTAAFSHQTLKQPLHLTCKTEQFLEHSALRKKKKKPKTTTSKQKPKHLRKLKCKDYMSFLCIIIFSLHAPSPVFLFVSESSKETKQQRT